MTETYSYSVDFGSSLDVGQFHTEVEESSITVALDGIRLNSDVVSVDFVSTISGAEKTTLDGLVSAHTPATTATFTVSNFIDGLNINQTTANRVNIQEGSCLDSTNTYIIRNTGTIGPVDISTSGEDGLDTGTEAASTWYAVHIIGDSTGARFPVGLLSLSATAPTLPTGFDIFRRIGWVRNDASSNFLDFEQEGTGRVRKIYYDETLTTMRALNAGSATTMTDVDLSAYIPSTITHVKLLIDYATGASGAATDFVRIRRKGFGSVGPIQLKNGHVSANPSSFMVDIPTNVNQVIQYLVSDGTNNTCTIVVVSYEDEL